MTKALFRQFWVFFTIALKASLRSPSAVFFGFFFPLIFIFSFAFVGNTPVQFKLGVTRTDLAGYSEYMQALEKNELFKIEYGNKEELTKKLEQGDIQAVIGFTGNNVIKITTNNARPQDNPIVIQSLSTINDKVSLAQKPVLFKLEQESLTGRSGKFIDFVLPGILGFSILSSAISGTSYSFVSLKKTLTLKRLFATPAKTAPFLLGQSLAKIVVGLAQNLLLLLVAIGFFGYSPQGGVLGLLQMLVVIMFGLVVFLGMGYVIAGMATSEDQVGPVSNLLSLPQFLLAGTFFPINTLPQWLQSGVKFLPLYNFNEAMRYVSLDGLSLWSSEVGMQLLFLTIWSVIIYFIASKVFSVKSY